MVEDRERDAVEEARYAGLIETFPDRNARIGWISAIGGSRDASRSR